MFKSIDENKEKCQEKVSKKETFLFNYLNQKFWKYKKFFGEKSDSYLLTLLGLLHFRGDKQVCYPSVSTLASFVGCCDRTVQRCVDELEADGLVAVYNPYKEGKCYRPNTYLLSKVFNLSRVKKKLFSTIKSCLSEYVTLLKDSFLTLYKTNKRYDNIPSYNSKSISLTHHIEMLKQFFSLKKIQRE